MPETFINFFFRPYLHPTLLNSRLPSVGHLFAFHDRKWGRIVSQKTTAKPERKAS